MSELKDNYKLGSKVESTIVNNLEWGATLYLSHSKYGVCSGDGCSSISINDTYLAGGNKQDTTTRNVYGVYDMAGAASEYAISEYGIGSATKEVKLENGDTWYQGHGMSYGTDYLVRGGINNGLFFFGDISTNTTNISSRSVLISK